MDAQISKDFINTMINEWLLWRKIKADSRMNILWRQEILTYLTSNDVQDLPKITDKKFIEFTDKVIQIIKKRRKLYQYACRKNQKRDWSFDAKTLKAYTIKHRDADDDTKFMIEARLTDANFHKICELLNNGQYDTALNLIASRNY